MPTKRWGIVPYFPVLSCGALTSFDSGESFSLSQIDRNTTANSARNSLCQFCNDSNQNVEVRR